MTRTYDWPLVSEFVNRTSDLARLQAWWESDERTPIALYGRRRVGKSWLFRRFANGKPAVILVAEQLAPGAQLERFARQLEPVLGVRPDLRDLPTLFRVLLRAARDTRLLVVIDELPWLLPPTSAAARRQLTALQAVLEDERDSSSLKLIVCGSTVAQMEQLFAERSPLHGRLTRLELSPLQYEHASGFMRDLGPVDRLERYAIAGGMPRYLGLLGHGSLRTVVTRQVLDRDGPLWNEGRLVLDQELRQPSVHFSLLEQLASGDKSLNELAQASHVEAKTATSYLASLAALRLVRRRLPIGVPPSSRHGLWRLDEPFFRFWFRFVFPFQADLESGLSADDLFDGEVAPSIGDHVAPVFEEWCRTWVRGHHGQSATRVGAWWGPSLDALRRRGERSSEEIDVVGTSRGRVTVVAEAKWTTRRMDLSVLADLEDHKLPALRQSGMRLAADLRIMLFSKAGYAASLRKAAETDPRVLLVDVASALGG